VVDGGFKLATTNF